MLPLMKVMGRDATPGTLVRWCKKAHAHATAGSGPKKAAPLRLTGGRYYVVAYTSHAPPPLTTLPRGTVVVGLAALEKLLHPLGALPLLQQLQSIACDDSDGDDSHSDDSDGDSDGDDSDSDDSGSDETSFTQ